MNVMDCETNSHAEILQLAAVESICLFLSERYWETHGVYNFTDYLSEEMLDNLAYWKSMRDGTGDIVSNLKQLLREI